MRYVSEPYSLDEDGLQRLLEFAKQGWEITIRAWGATHFPGHTVAVEFRRKEQRPKAPLPEP